MNAAWHTTAGLHYLELVPERGADELPLIIALHGRGADATDLAGLSAEIHPDGYRWVFPQAPLPVPLGLGNMGWAWYALEENRAQTVIESRNLLATFVHELLGEQQFTRSRVAVMGFSQGAAMALHLALSSPEPFGAVVAMSGYVPAAESLGDLSSAPAQPILMVHGTEDQTLPVHLAREARDLLQRAGLPLQYEEFLMGHQISLQSLQAVRRFLHEVFPPVEIS
jgi:phospholipase/carboxylesterase